MSEQAEIIEKLASDHPWPIRKPDLGFNSSGWFPICNQNALRRFLNENTKIVVELGAWVGLSTRWLTSQAPNAKVITIDHWLGSPENKDDPLVPILYEQFIANCWNYQSKIIPIRADTEIGIKKLKDSGLKPDLIYIDAGHDYKSAGRDLEACMDFNCPLVGDDFNPNSWAGVVRAVWEEANNGQRMLQVKGSAWMLTKE